MKISYHSKETIYKQIVTQMVEFIALGVYKPSDKLPSIRELSKQLKVNPNTIFKSYRELEEKGFIYSIAGKGSYVSEINEHTKSITMENLKDSIHQVILQSQYIGIGEESLNQMIHDEYKRMVE